MSDIKNKKMKSFKFYWFNPNIAKGIGEVIGCIGAIILLSYFF